MRNLIPKLRQTSIISEKPGFLSEKLKALSSTSYHRFPYFFTETLHTFSSQHCLQKHVWDFLNLFRFRLELLVKV